jgi:hypothetical protein
MSNKSRRRVTVAASAILAGAAFPIAAAGTAWADDTGQTPVQVSINGKVVIDNTKGTTSAVSGPGGTAIAIGGGSSASATNGDHDLAIAKGPGSSAAATDGDHDLAIANGDNSTAKAGSGDNDTAVVSGNGLEADASGNGVTSIVPPS